MAKHRFSHATLTKHLHKLADEVIDVSKATLDPITRAERLASVVWDLALGCPYIDKNGEEQKKPPVQWAVQMIFDRLEGKVADIADTKETVSLAEKIGQVHKAKLNALTEAVVDGNHQLDSPREDDGAGDDDGDWIEDDRN